MDIQGSLVHFIFICKCDDVLPVNNDISEMDQLQSDTKLLTKDTIGRLILLVINLENICIPKIQ